MVTSCPIRHARENRAKRGESLVCFFFKARCLTGPHETAHAIGWVTTVAEAGCHWQIITSAPGHKTRKELI